MKRQPRAPIEAGQRAMKISARLRHGHERSIDTDCPREMAGATSWRIAGGDRIAWHWLSIAAMVHLGRAIAVQASRPRIYRQALRGMIADIQRRQRADFTAPILLQQSLT